MLFKKNPNSTKDNSGNNTISENVNVGQNCVIKLSIIKGDISIGDNSRINSAEIYGKVLLGRYCSIWGPNIDIYSLHNKVTIGSFTSIARNTSIQEYNHIIDRCSTYFMFQNVFKEENGILNDTVSPGEISIGNDVWIGAHCTIVPGAKIGDGCVIGANSVVTGEIPPYSIAVGSPAKVIKLRFEKEIVDKLMEIKWWLWPLEKIMRNKELFTGTLTMEKLSSIID